MVGYTGLKESSIKILKTGEGLIISCRACLFFFFVFWWQKNNISFKFLFTFNPWLLNSFDLPSSGIEEKIHTKAASDVSRGEEF